MQFYVKARHSNNTSLGYTL